ncbi:hypothetical protein CYY_004638 [Polysphondylium violaceum]|uniref:Uncharacterized protein n=1 Tax=Polysphondylium violaceum TaxID=133409 RepID=A0A8J4V7L4_9MYCE|nr:hypothetical protein CYY_004638 [Polysphondylium violaceum]
MSKRKAQDDDNLSGSETEDESTTTTMKKNKPLDQDEYDRQNQSIIDLLSHTNITELKEEDYQDWFNNIAYQLQNNVILYINEIPHLMIELEFYFKGYKHNDLFAHCDVMQLEKASWYFHRTNGTFRGGSFKGLDITFGCGDDVYGGILIRSLKRVDSQSTIVDGPSLCVDHILKLTKQADIKTFVATAGRSVFESKNPLLYLKMLSDVDSSAQSSLPKPGRIEDMFGSGRVGLTFKRYKPTMEYFIAQNYRFLRYPDKVKKGKHYMVLSDGLQGKGPVEIKNRVGSTVASIEKILKQITTGSKKTRANIKDYKTDLNNDAVCQLLALCAKLTKERLNGTESSDANGDDGDDQDENDNQDDQDQTEDEDQE